MTPGELFDLDEVERFGNPWHGLAHSGSGGTFVDLPNGGTRTIPAWDGFGDSYQIAIPGQAAVTTSTDDVADGMTWLNYGIMYGRDKYLYGQPIGAMSWIYIDADLVPWLAECTWSADLLSVSLKRFGIMEGVPETYYYSVALVPRSDIPELSASVSLRLDDIDSRGRQVVLTFKQSLSTIGDQVRAIWLLAISGAGAAATLTVSHQADGPDSLADASHLGANLDRYWFQDDNDNIAGPFERQVASNGDVSYPGRPAGNWLRVAFARVNGKSVDSLIKRIIGGTLINDTFELVKAVRRTEVDLVSVPVWDSLFSSTWWTANHPEHGSGMAAGDIAYFARAETYTMTGYYGIELGGLLTKVDVTEQWTAYPIIGDQEGDGTDYQHGSVVDSVKVDSVVVPSHFQGGGYALNFNIGEPVYELRIANRVYLAVTAQAGFSPGFELLVSGPASGQAIRQAPLSTGLTRATANPISGALVIDRQNPVAFI